MELPNAADARMQVERGLHEKANKQMAMITQAINQAINQGKTSIFLDGVYPEPAIRRQLENKGYKVSSSSFRNDQTLSISW